MKLTLWILAALFCCAVPVPTEAAFPRPTPTERQGGGPPVMGEDAMDVRITYKTAVVAHIEALDARTAKDGASLPTPPASSSPGDERTDEWTECDSANHCTRFTRTDRYQRTDAPRTTGSNPNEGRGPLDWVPFSWGSSSCATANACLILVVKPT